MKFARVRNVPDIRFKNFSGYWSFKPLSYFASQVKKKNTNQAESYVLTNSAKLGIIGQEEFFDREIAKNENLAKYYVVHVGDFIYNPRKSASASAGPIKRNKYAKGVVSPIYTVFQFSKGNPDFFEQFFNSTKWHQYMKSIANYGARFDRLNITRTEFFNLPLPCIDEEEQQKIASFLSSVDTKIEQLGKKKALLEQYKKGIMQKLFSQEIRFKDEQGNDYPDWEESCIHDICQINPTSGSLPNTFYYIDLESVHKGILVKQSKVKKINAPSRAQRLLRKQDVLFQTVRPYQKNNYYFELDGDYVASTGYAQLRAKASSRFLFYLLHVQNIVNTMIARCTGTSYPAINSNDLGTIKVLVPAKYEQQKIANFLSAIDKKIELVAQQLEQARTFKKGLLQQMFI